jgi:hypothetical protein
MARIEAVGQLAAIKACSGLFSRFIRLRAIDSGCDQARRCTSSIFFEHE